MINEKKAPSEKEAEVDFFIKLLDTLYLTASRISISNSYQFVPIGIKYQFYANSLRPKLMNDTLYVRITP